MTDIPSLPPTSPGGTTRPVALVGMMAVGKTSVGVELARRLERPFVDLDALLVEREGRPISEIFDTDGEDHFRLLESQLLAEILGRPDSPVISTGGGIVKAFGNRSLLRARAVTIWLRAQPDLIVERAEGNPDRPLLQPSGGESFTALVTRLDTERRPLYSEVADIVVDTDDDSPAAIAARVAARLERVATP